MSDAGLLEAVPHAIVGISPDGHIVLVNAQAERLFGYPREELLGQPIEILVPQAGHDLRPAHRDQYLRNLIPHPMGAGMELAGRRKDGIEFPAEISLSALEIEEGVVVSAAIRDVTEQLEVRAERDWLRAQAERDRLWTQAERERLRAQAERDRLWIQAERERLEARLVQSERLESLGQLAGGVAHDFNNLLAVILNYGAFVAEELAAAASGPDGERWEVARKDITQIQRAAERAADLTRQLLTFSRREVVCPRVLNLNTVVVEIKQLLQRTLGEHVQLVTSLTEDLWPVLADPGQMEQVLVNLAVNARDAMPGGGTLTIDTGNVDLDEEGVQQRPLLTAGRHVRLRVSDTGVGMPPDVLAQVFEPFYTTKPKGEGTGLGLATVCEIITQAAGDVHPYSSPGIGTTVTTLLPVTDEEPAPMGRDRVTLRTSRGETVLVVEDEDALREVACRALTRNGYQVLSAASGAEAVRAARLHRGDIHLLLTDVIMPQMFGKEVVEAIRVLRPETRVLYMSGYAQPVLTSQGALGPGVVLVEKPFSEYSLLDKIREVLDHPP